MQRTIVAICLAIAPLLAVATIYKVRLPDGTILFTDSPPAGAKVIEERESAAPPPRAPAKAASPATPRARPAPAAPAPESQRAAESPPRTLDAANAEITDAERELAVARRRLEEGREPLPGERTGLAKGGSRLTPEYEARVAGLERDVAAAEERVRRAYDGKNALR